MLFKKEKDCRVCIVFTFLLTQDDSDPSSSGKCVNLFLSSYFSNNKKCSTTSFKSCFLYSLKSFLVKTVFLHVFLKLRQSFSHFYKQPLLKKQTKDAPDLNERHSGHQDQQGEPLVDPQSAAQHGHGEQSCGQDLQLVRHLMVTKRGNLNGTVD